MNDLKEQRQRLRTLMQYSVPEDQLDAARDVLLMYRDDRIALAVMEEFYSYLPDAQEDILKELRIVGRKKGVFLLAAVTNNDAFLYLVSSEGIEFHGSLLEGYLDRQLLDFFEFPSAEAFKEAGQHVANMPMYEPLQIDVDICPACHVGTGEEHELGCPLELCPWCGGQLIHCKCRFEQLGVDEIGGEADLERFEKILEQRGRIVYSSEQRPDFADDGEGVEFE